MRVVPCASRTSDPPRMSQGDEIRSIPTYMFRRRSHTGLERPLPCLRVSYVLQKTYLDAFCILPTLNQTTHGSQ